jgi:hypothetical protein
MYNEHLYTRKLRVNIYIIAASCGYRDVPFARDERIARGILHLRD